MNEELKIIIKAVTAEAQKNMQEIKKELQGISGESKKTSGKFSAAMKGFAKAAAIAVAAVGAVIAAVVALGKKTLESQKQLAQLNSAFQAMGKSATSAANVYKGFYRFLGDADTATEASNLLIKLTQDEKNLTEWTKTLQGVYASFPDSLPIEGLVESANETARVGKVTGNLADALNWAGSSEEAFNAKLAQTTSYEEREALIRETLTGLYGKAAENYEKNNKAILEYNESQAKLNSSMTKAGASVTPLLTALNNLGAALFDLLRPALEAIIPPLTTMVNWIAQAVSAVVGLFSAISGATTSVKTSMDSVASGNNAAVNGANSLASGYNNAAKAAEAVKRATLGFDELNVVGSNSSSGSSGSSAPAYMTPQINSNNFVAEVETTEKEASGFAKLMKSIADTLKDVFAPAISSWKEQFADTKTIWKDVADSLKTSMKDATSSLKESWNEAKSSFATGANDILISLGSVVGYVVNDFAPSIIKSIAEDVVPVFTDTFGFAIKEVGLLFQDFAYLTKDITDNIVVPVFDLIKNVVTGLFETVSNVWAERGQPFMEALSGFFANIRENIVTIYENFLKPVITKIIDVVSNLWENNLKPFVQKLIDAVIEIGTCILTLYNKYIAPIVQWIIDYILPIVRFVIDNIIDAVGRFIDVVTDILGGVIDAIKGVIQFITGVFTGDWKKAWEGIKNIFGGIWDAIVGIFDSVWQTIKSIFSVKKAKEYFGLVINAIKSVFGGIADWFGNIFAKAWNAVKNVFSKGGKIFDGIKDGILEGLKNVVNKLIEGINKVIKKPFEGLNNALKKIKDISILGIEPFSWLGTIKIPQIPLLAQGGVVNEATLAMIGEQGREAVVPLENNTGWMDSLVGKLAKVLVNDNPDKIVLNVDGKELAWAAIKGMNNITRQTGSLPLQLT